MSVLFFFFTPPPFDGDLLNSVAVFFIVILDVFISAVFLTNVFYLSNIFVFLFFKIWTLPSYFFKLFA